MIDFQITIHGTGCGHDERELKRRLIVFLSRVHHLSLSDGLSVNLPIRATAPGGVSCISPVCIIYGQPKEDSGGGQPPS